MSLWQRDEPYSEYEKGQLHQMVEARMAVIREIVGDVPSYCERWCDGGERWSDVLVAHAREHWEKQLRQLRKSA